MMPSLLLIQWGIVGFYVVLHFFIGFMRGTSKSTYFTIVNILMTIVTLLLISLISLNLILSASFTFQDLVARVQGITGNIIPEDVVTYITDPALTGFIVAIIDLVLRIIGFFVLYPIIKGFFTLIIFRPIWSFGIKKSLLRKQNEKLQIEFNEKQTGKKRFVPRKRLQKNISSRFFGGTIGAVNGLVVAFIFLLPVLVMASFVSGFNNNTTVANHTNTELSTTNEELVTIPNEIQQYLNQVAEMNEKGFSSITRQIVIQDKPIDRLIFDMIFTTYVVEGEEKTPINFIGELESLIGIAEVVYVGGYLDDDFDYRDISSDNLDDIEKIFTHIGNSNLMGYMIPFATKYGVENLLPDYIDGVNLYDRPGSAAALDEFTSIDWSDEFNNIYGIVEAILEFGSVAEILTYTENPELMLELSPEEGARLADIVRAIGNMETFSLISVAADYATTLTEIQQEISWMDPAEVEGYLQHKLSFIIDNPQFFTGSDGEISRIANLIEAIYSDEFGDVNLVELVNSVNDPETFLENQNAEWTGSLLEKIVEIQLLIESIPIGVDYGVYNTLGDQIERDLADQISESLNEVGWDEEILNVGDIYKEVLKLGLSRAFGVEPDYFSIVDDIAVNHMDSVRTVVEKIFEESQVINTAIELASPIIIDTLVNDQELKELIQDALISDPDSGVVDFRFGQEVNNLLTMIESIYQFTTATQLTSISSMTQDAQIELFAGFGSLTEVQYGRFISAIEELQIFERTGASGLQYAKDKLAIEQLYVPEEVQLGEELSSIIGFIYYAASYTYENRFNYLSYEEIDFAPLLADEIFRSHLLATELENHSHLLLSNIAHNLMVYAEDQNISQYLAIPESLSLASPESEDWMDELNALLGAVFDLGASFEGSEAITLSVKDVLTLTQDPMSAPISLITQFQDVVKANEAFGSLDASQILRTSIVNAIDNIGPTFTSSFNGYELKTPEIARDDDMIKVGMIVELIHGLATVIDDANNTLNYQTFADISSTTYMYDYVNAFNNLEDTSLETLADITLLRGFISDALLNPDLQAYARAIVNNSGNITVSDGFLAFEREDNVLSTSDLSELFISVKSMQITEPFYANPGAGIYAFLQTFDDEKLDKVFDAKILKEIFTFALTDPEGLQSLAGIAESAYSGVQSTQGMLGAINPRFLPIVSSLGTYRDEDDLFDVNEIKALIKAFNNLNVSSSADLSALSSLDNIHKKVRNTTVVENLFESNWLYDQVNYVFTNDEFLEELAVIASQQVLNQTGLDKEFTKDDVSFALDKYDMIEVGGRREGGVKVVEIKKFILAGTRLDWGSLELGTGAGIASNLSTILMQDGTDGDRHIDVILESNLLVAIFDKLLNFEYNGIGMDEVAIAFLNTKLEGVAVLEGLQLEKEFLHYDVRAYDEKEVLRREEIIEMIEAVSYIDLNQTIGVPTFYQMIENGTFDQIFDSYIIHSLVSNALTNEDVQQLGVTKGNNAQSIVELGSDFLTVDPVLMDGDLFKQSEIENIVIALYTLGLVDNASFSSINLSTFTSLSGQNVDVDTGEDDFDRVFNAHYIYIILDRVLKLETLGDYVGTTLGNALDTEVTNLDLTPHPAMLGDASNSEVEEGRVTKAEFRRITESLAILGDISGVGLSTFTAMIDPYNEDDEFSQFIASDYIYIILARLFENEGFGNYVGTLLAGAFGDDQETPDMTPPSDAKGSTVGSLDENVMTRVELRNLFVSFRLLGEDPTQIGIDSVMNLIDQNYDPVAEEDDMDRFLTSLYIQDKLSVILLSESVIEMIANGLFDPTEFELPSKATTSIDGKERMNQDELRKIFLGLQALGINDQESLGEINEEKIFGLSDSEVDTVIASDYLYTVIDLALKGQETFDIPSSALETPDDEDYPNKIKKSEIKDIFKAIDLLGASSPDDFDPELITIAQVKDVLDQTDSAIVQKLLSDAIIEAIGEDKIPLDAYDEEGVLTVDEMNALILALEVIAGTDQVEIVNVDFEHVTVGQVNDIDLTETGSKIVKQLISDEMLNALDVSEIPEDAYHQLSLQNNVTLLGMTLEGENDPLRRLSDDELREIVLALNILADDPNNADPEFDPMAQELTQISTSATVGQAIQLKTNNSLIIRQLMSDNIITTLSVDTDIPQESYDTEYPSMLSIDEISALLDAMLVLANNDENVLVEEIETDVNVGQAKQFKGTTSYIIKQLISDAIIEAIDPLEEGKIPLEAYIDSDPNNRLEDDEIDAMIDALGILGEDHELVSEISTEVTVGQAVEFKGTESLIIQQLLSDAIVEAIDPLDEGKIPPKAYIGLDPANRLEPTEIDFMIDALVILANDDLSTNVKEVSSVLTVGQLTDLDTINSIIMKQQMSDQIIKAVGVDNVPNEAYDQDDPNRLSNEEITHMIGALTILAENNVAEDPEITDVNDVVVEEVSTDVTVGQAKQLDDENESIIIKQIISNSIVDMMVVADIAIPLSAHEDGDNENRLTDEEISYMIDALTVLANGDEDAKVSEVVFDETQLSVGALRGFNEDSIILNRIISTSLIQNLPNMPDESYVEYINSLDPDYKKDILRSEIDNLLEALETLGVDTNGASNIGTDQVSIADLDYILALGTPGSDYEHPTETFSPLVAHIMSTPMIEAVSDVRSGYNYGIPSKAYRNDHDLSYYELTKLVEALKYIGNIGTNPGQEDPEETTLDEVIITPSDFGPVLLEDLIGVESQIVYRMISIGINDAGIATVPSRAVFGDDNFDDDLPAIPEIYDIKITEMNHIVLSMNHLGIGSVDTIDDIEVDDLKGLDSNKVDDLVEAPYTIIYYIISDKVDSTNTLFDGLVVLYPDTYPAPADDYYVLDEFDNRVRLKRTSIAAAIDEAS